MNKKKVLLIVIGVLLIVSVSIGLTYAYYMATVTQNGENVVKTDCFEISYADKDEISLSDSFPMRDADGANLTPYEFTIKNVCSTTQYYEVNLETLSTSTIDESKIKVKLDNKTPYLYGSDGYTSNKMISTAKNAIKLASGTLTANQEKTYDLRLWLDESVTTSTPNIINKTFQSKVTIFASQNNRSFSIAIQRNNSTIKEDRVQGTKLDGVLYEYDLSDTDITNATNISCNEDAQAVIEDNKLKISNMHENTICKINDTLKSTIDNLDDSLTNIKMIKNEDNVTKMEIGSTKEVVLDLNGKEIKGIGVNETSTTMDNNNIVLNIKGKLILNDDTNNGGIHSGPTARTFDIYGNGKLIINGGKYSGRQTVYASYSNSYIEINDGIFDSALYNTVAVDYCKNCKIIINGGTYSDNSTSPTSVLYIGGNNTDLTSSIEVNGGTFTSTGKTIDNNSGTININGGIFNKLFNSSDLWSPLIRNIGNLTINGGNYTSEMRLLVNTNGGITNINNGSFTSSLSCIGVNQGTVNINNGNFYVNGSTLETAKSLFNEVNSSPSSWTTVVVKESIEGTININGGTFKSLYGFGFRNQGLGTINIKNAEIETNEYASVINNNASGSSGTINICKVDLLNNKNIINSGTSYIYYANNAFGSVTPTFTGTTANIQVKNDVCN